MPAITPSAHTPPCSGPNQDPGPAHLNPAFLMRVVCAHGQNSLPTYLPAGQLPAGTQTIVNIEWGGFWSPRLPRHAAIDDAVDGWTSHKGGFWVV